MHVRSDSVSQQHSRFFCTHKRGGAEQACQSFVQLISRADTARRIQLREQRVDACLLQRPRGSGWDVSDIDFHGALIFIAA